LGSQLFDGLNDFLLLDLNRKWGLFLKTAADYSENAGWQLSEQGPAVVAVVVAHGRVQKGRLTFES
jgi:hypothetical protein